jgi:hypothetical protein
MTDPVRRWQVRQEQMLLNRGSPEAMARSDPHRHWAVLCMIASPRDVHIGQNERVDCARGTSWRGCEMAIKRQRGTPRLSTTPRLARSYATAGRLDTPSMPVSSSAFPARPPQPS